MSRPRVRRPYGGQFPPQLAEFDVADWWVTDPTDPLELGYARMRWDLARQVFEEGGDWESHLAPPVWWELRNN